MSAPTWHRSSYCSSGGCVEVAAVDGAIHVRDSKNPGVPALEFTVEEWTAFLAGAAEFDPASPHFADAPPCGFSMPLVPGSTGRMGR
jgi:hypothetical protein